VTENGDTCKYIVCCIRHFSFSHYLRYICMHKQQ